MCNKDFLFTRWFVHDGHPPRIIRESSVLELVAATITSTQDSLAESPTRKRARVQDKNTSIIPRSKRARAG